MFFCAIPTSAVCNYMDRCAPQTEDTKPKPMLFFNMNPPSANFLLEDLAQNIIENEIRKATGQTVDVNLKIFNIPTFADGKFKSISLTGNNVVVEGIHISAFKAQTLCEFNQINLKSRPISLQENLVVGVWAEFSADDLRNTLMYKNYSHEFSKINLSEIGISEFRVYPETIDIQNNRLYFTINAIPSNRSRAIDINMDANLLVENGQVLNSRFNYVNLYSGFDLTNLTNLFSSLNNLNFSFDLYGKAHRDVQPKAEVQIMNLEIIKNKIYVNGVVFIPRKAF